jgi:hypothetical protein
MKLCTSFWLLFFPFLLSGPLRLSAAATATAATATTVFLLLHMLSRLSLQFVLLRSTSLLLRSINFVSNFFHQSHTLKVKSGPWQI